tara:strand:- start:227 stop:592 length:366 start_codon:yes stop_codon:yes gene_type:complete
VTTCTAQDAEFLLSRPEFLRFLYDAIQSAGIVSNNTAADGRSVRDQCLEWHEGRRSLGHEILLMAEEGQPDVLRSPDGTAIATLDAVLREAMNPKEKPSGRRTPRHDDYDRYDDLDDDAER